MAELTNLETKLGEVIGLAMAGQAVTQKVITLAKKDGGELVQRLKQMKEETAETQQRATEVAASFNGKKSAIITEARSVKKKGAEMMGIYLNESSDALDGFEFLTMVEAGEVGHWNVLQTLGRNAKHKQVNELVRWALPLQKNHLKAALDGSIALAAKEDPDSTE